MTRPWVVTLFWAALLAIHWVVMWAIFNPDVLPAALLGGSALVTALGGAHLAWVARRDRRRREEVVVEAVPDLSLATMLVGVGLAALPLGAFLGPWISLIGAGVVLWGLAGVLNERRASRRAAAAVAGTERAPDEETAVGPQGASGQQRTAERGAEPAADRSGDKGSRSTAKAAKGGAGKEGGGRRSSSRSRRPSRR